MKDEQAQSSLATARPVGVSGRLTVADREAALRELGALAARVGAVQPSRLPADRLQAAGAVELVVPREAYPALVEGLARIGEWRPDREPAELPAEVRVTVHLAGP
jgi:hypothetical protein